MDCGKEQRFPSCWNLVMGRCRWHCDPAAVSQAFGKSHFWAVPHLVAEIQVAGPINRPAEFISALRMVAHG